MATIIKHKDTQTGYYTGDGWDNDKSKAKRYDKAIEAVTVIHNHGMDAQTEDDGGSGNQSGGGSIDR